MKKEELYADLSASRWSYFYGLSWTLSLASKTLDAIGLSGGVRLLLGSGMSGTLSPVKHVHRTNINADSVSRAALPIDCHVRSVDSKLRWRLHGSPHFVP